MGKSLFVVCLVCVVVRLGQVKTDDDFNGVLKDVTDKASHTASSLCGAFPFWQVSESHKRAELNAVLKEIKKWPWHVHKNHKCTPYFLVC